MEVDKRASLSDLIPLEDVCRLLPTRTHRSTVFRWAQKGRRGVRLKVVTVGSTRCTTEAWLMEFFAAVEGARGCSMVVVASARRRSRQARIRARQHKTMEILRRHGLAGDDQQQVGA